MRLRGEQLRRLASEGGIAPEQLAQSIERTGLTGERASRAVINWMAGRDHPRCKATDIARLAQAVGANPRQIAQFTSEVKYHRGSTRKARLLADLIRGKRVGEALDLLSFSPKRAAVNMKKCLLAALADAQHFEADEDALVVAVSRVDEAPPIKRFRPKDRGRSHPILKPTSHITIGVEERA